MDWSMGGYGFYVWGSYIFAFLAIAIEVFSLIKRKRSSEQCAGENPSKTSHSPQASAWRSDSI